MSSRWITDLFGLAEDWLLNLETQALAARAATPDVPTVPAQNSGKRRSPPPIGRRFVKGHSGNSGELPRRATPDTIRQKPAKKKTDAVEAHARESERARLG